MAIPRSKNALSDLLCRFVDPDHWRLDPTVFQRLDFRWSPHSIERFLGASTLKFSGLIRSVFRSVVSGGHLGQRLDC